MQRQGQGPMTTGLLVANLAADSKRHPADAKVDEAVVLLNGFRQLCLFTAFLHLNKKLKNMARISDDSVEYAIRVIIYLTDALHLQYLEGQAKIQACLKKHNLLQDAKNEKDVLTKLVTHKNIAELAEKLSDLRKIHGGEFFSMMNAVIDIGKNLTPQNKKIIMLFAQLQLSPNMLLAYLEKALHYLGKIDETAELKKIFDDSTSDEMRFKGYLQNYYLQIVNFLLTKLQKNSEIVNEAHINAVLQKLNEFLAVNDPVKLGKAIQKIENKLPRGGKKFVKFMKEVVTDYELPFLMFTNGNCMSLSADAVKAMVGKSVELTKKA